LPILTEIRVPRRGSRRRTLVLDGEPWRDASADVLAVAHLEQGSEIDPADLQDTLAAAEPRCARERAVRLLTYRERSVAELRERLADDGYLPETIDGAIERLASAGLVDDERFARSFARNITQIRRLGRVRALRDLISHGVDPDLATSALDEALPIEDEYLAARDLARALAGRPGVTRDKIAGRLVRRGYAPRVALTAAREAMLEADERADGSWEEGESDGPADGLDGL
jgi:regulatory protein